tara:strand:- start:184 stop:360 length:177 start_codon:yes stop_codon:yes gene_type:complete
MAKKVALPQAIFLGLLMTSLKSSKYNHTNPSRRSILKKYQAIDAPRAAKNIKNANHKP